MFAAPVLLALRTFSESCLAGPITIHRNWGFSLLKESYRQRLNLCRASGGLNNGTIQEIAGWMSLKLIKRYSNIVARTTRNSPYAQYWWQ
jgi:hypothetical protein